VAVILCTWLPGAHTCSHREKKKKTDPEPGEWRHGVRFGCSRFALSSCFVADVTVEDGTKVAPGAKFTKTWKLKNDGDRAWPEGTQFKHVYGPRMTEYEAVPVPALAPGEEVDISVDMVAPAEAGPQVSNWRLVGPRGYLFGHRVWAHIIVEAETQEQATETTTTQQPIIEAEDSNSDGESEGFEIICNEKIAEVVPEPAVEAPKEEVPEPVIVEEPVQQVPQEPEEEEPLRSLLEQLETMGFSDRAANKQRLLKNKLNVILTIHQLLDN